MLTWKLIFQAADVPSAVGYRLIDGRGGRRRREDLLRIGWILELSLGEMQELLNLYDTYELYIRRREDVVWIKAFSEAPEDRIIQLQELQRIQSLPSEAK